MCVYPLDAHLLLINFLVEAEMFLVRNVNTGGSLTVWAVGEAEARANAYRIHPEWFGCWLIVRECVKEEEELSDAAEELSDWEEWS